MQDCTLYHHVFQDATRPASKANPQGIALNTKGDIVYACKAAVSTPTGIEQITSRIMRYVTFRSYYWYNKSISNNSQ